VIGKLEQHGNVQQGVNNKVNNNKVKQQGQQQQGQQQDQTNLI
jgi:hypothetical protein